MIHFLYIMLHNERSAVRQTVLDTLANLVTCARYTCIQQMNCNCTGLSISTYCQSSCITRDSPSVFRTRRTLKVTKTTSDKNERGRVRLQIPIKSRKKLELEKNVLTPALKNHSADCSGHVPDCGGDQSRSFFSKFAFIMQGSNQWYLKVCQLASSSELHSELFSCKNGSQENHRF